jgi:hypothetical protein
MSFPPPNLQAFSKKQVDDRKEWLTNFMEDRRQRKLLGLPEVRVVNIFHKMCFWGGFCFFVFFSRLGFSV